MPSGKQENAPPATIPGNTNLELLKHQSENEQDFVSLLHIVISEKKNGEQWKVREISSEWYMPRENMCSSPLKANYLKLLNQCSAN